MNDDIRTKVHKAVQAEHGWNSEEVQLVELTGLELPPCRFYNVVRKGSKDPFGLDYAVLPDGSLISSAEEEAAARILTACAGRSQPSAAAWAEVLARFHPDVGPGTVLRDAAQASAAVERLRAGGQGFEPPALGTAGGEVTVRFYLMDYESGVLSQVTATRRGDGTVEVSKAKAF
jgi:hypothetical protein